ncbi:hypothetical protein BX265_2328 [Streptomyces sp. TLI_235]|nr:hypothetical protein [Streptomyces sp. TLI_235]PBC77577.1 hypothetical protein BX265_2328 [Streptomyces sp. TLI_235]
MNPLTKELNLTPGALSDDRPLACPACDSDLQLTLITTLPPVETWPAWLLCRGCGHGEDTQLATNGMVEAAITASRPGPAFAVEWRERTLAGVREPDLDEQLLEVAEWAVEEGKKEAKKRIRQVKAAPGRLARRLRRTATAKTKEAGRNALAATGQAAEKVTTRPAAALYGAAWAARGVHPDNAPAPERKKRAKKPERTPPWSAYRKALGIGPTWSGRGKCLVCNGTGRIAHPTLTIPCKSCR